MQNSEAPDVVEAVVAASPEPKAKSKKSSLKQESSGFCVYIGPSIRGVIQSGTIYPESREKTLKKLAPHLEKYPLIAKLIVSDKTFADDRVKVKTAGTLLNVYYQRLLSGKNE